MQVDATDYGPELLPPECSHGFPTSRIFPQAVIPMPGMVACPSPPLDSVKNAHCTHSVEQTSRGDQRIALYSYDPVESPIRAIVIVPRLISVLRAVSEASQQIIIAYASAQLNTVLVQAANESQSSIVHVNRFVLKYVYHGSQFIPSSS